VLGRHVEVLKLALLFLPCCSLDSLSFKTRLTMQNAAEPKQKSMIERVREAIGESLMGLAVWVCGNSASFDTLQSKVDDLEREIYRLRSEVQAAKRQRLSTQPTRGDLFQTDVLMKRVMEFVGPDEYFFAASISRSCRQVQIELSRKRAERSDSKQAKLCTSFTAASASPARLRWAFSSGLKQKGKYKKPLQLVQSAVKASGDPAAVLGLLNVQSLKKVGLFSGCRLCETTAARGDLKLLKWLHAHHCPWDQQTCFNAAWKGHLHVLQWARAHGCAWH
jgi:hypothetical protein